MGPAVPVALLMPGAIAGEWELCRATAGGRDRCRWGRGFRQCHPAGLSPRSTPQRQNLQPAEAFVLSLPVETGLVQTLVPSGGRARGELEEMVRIQLEKIFALPGRVRERRGTGGCRARKRGGRGRGRDGASGQAARRSVNRSSRRRTLAGARGIPGAGPGREARQGGGTRGVRLPGSRAGSSWGSARAGG